MPSARSLHPYLLVIRMRMLNLLSSIAAASALVLVSGQTEPVQNTQQSPFSDLRLIQASGVPGQPVHAETEADRSMRAELESAFSREPDLKDCGIGVFVDHGEVTIDGSVRSRMDLEKANDVAMNVPGVKSVSNMLKLSTCN